jgi:hypothetical protein
LKLFNKEKDQTASLFAAFISIIVGGAIFYTITGLISALTQTEVGFVARASSITEALIVGPLAGLLAGLGYGAIGLIPATLFFQRNKKLSNLIRAEVIIIFAITIFVMMDLIWQVVYEPVRWEIYFYYFPQTVLKTLVIFGSFPLIGVAVIYGFKYGFKKIKTLLK